MRAAPSGDAAKAWSRPSGVTVPLYQETDSQMLTWMRRPNVCRPLEGEPPTIDVAVGYSKSNTSPILKLFLSRLDELVGPNQKH